MKMKQRAIVTKTGTIHCQQKNYVYYTHTRACAHTHKRYLHPDVSIVLYHSKYDLSHNLPNSLQASNAFIRYMWGTASEIQ